MLRSIPVFRGSPSRAVRIAIAAVLLAAATVPALAGRAVGEESLSDLKARMESIQARLDAAAAKVEELRDETGHLEQRIDEIDGQIAKLDKDNAELEKQVVKRARLLYVTGGTSMMEVLLGSDDLSELSNKTEMLSELSLDDADIFIRLSRSKAELNALQAELSERESELEAKSAELKDASDELQDEFAAIQDEYEELREELAPPVVTAPSIPSTPSEPVVFEVSGTMACPVGGPSSFIDSWGAPRSGHTHQGVDMMAGQGTPVLAIVSGTITLSDYGSSAGYWQILSGDDGNSYWYMHNEQNIVNGGHVEVGRQIATVGGTGNANGNPHLHFEFHPGGGSAVNPYPLVSSIC